MPRHTSLIFMALASAVACTEKENEAPFNNGAAEAICGADFGIAWEEVTIVDDGGLASEAQLAEIQSVLATFASRASNPLGCVEVIALQSELTLEEESVDSYSDYTENTIHLSLGSADLGLSTAHELCHFLNYNESYSTDNPDLFPYGSVEKSAIHSTQAQRSEEAFALACEVIPEEAAAVYWQDTCGWDVLDATAYFISTTVFPEEAPAEVASYGSTSAIDITWKEAKLNLPHTPHSVAIDQDGFAYLLEEPVDDTPNSAIQLHALFVALDGLSQGEPFPIAVVDGGEWGMVRTDASPLVVWRKDGVTEAWELSRLAQTATPINYPVDAGDGLGMGEETYDAPPPLETARAFGDLLLYSDNETDAGSAAEWLHAYDLFEDAAVSLPRFEGADLGLTQELHSYNDEIVAVSQDQGLVSLDPETLTWTEHRPIARSWLKHGAFPMKDGRALVGFSEHGLGGLAVYDSAKGIAEIPANVCDHELIGLSRLTEYGGEPILVQAVPSTDAPLQVGLITVK